MAENASRLGAIGCGLVLMSVMCCGGFAGGGLLGVSAILKQSDPYQEAMVVVQANDMLQRDLGTPIQGGTLVWGSLETSGGSGDAELNWAVSGPHGSATVIIDAHKSGGKWSYETLIARLDSNGDVIDLLGTRVLDDGPTVSAARSFVAEGEFLLRDGQYAEARYQFDQALGLQDDDDDALAGRGEAALREGDLEAAINDLERAVGFDPDQVDRQMVLGEAYATALNWEGCVSAYTAALLTDPELPKAWFYRAVCFEKQGEPRKALAGAREACNLQLGDACKMAIRLGGKPR